MHCIYRFSQPIVPSDKEAFKAVQIVHRVFLVVIFLLTINLSLVPRVLQQYSSIVM